MFQEREIKTNETFHQSITFLQNDLLIKNETIRPLTEIQTTILEAPFRCNQQHEGNLTNQPINLSETTSISTTKADSSL